MTDLAQTYREAYLEGIKTAKELVDYAISLETAKESLTRMIETLNKKETTK